MNSNEHDVFISYSHKDKNWVDQVLLPRLRDHGFKVLIDDDFTGGGLSLQQMENAVKFSKRVLAVLTPDYIDSDWSTLENVMARSLDPSARNRKLIPILYKTTNIPLRLSVLVYRDLRDDDNSIEWDRLMQDLM